MSNRKPNVIFIMTDEQHVRSLSCYGGPVSRTPAIDSLAAGGVKFNSANCTNPLCMPSRACFMTGRYSHVNGVLCNGFNVPAHEITLPQVLREAGYRTAICGKNHFFPGLYWGWTRQANRISGR